MYENPREVRNLIRRGELARPTAGLAPGYAQANLVILPKEVAFDFFDGLSDFRSRFLSAGAENVHLTGAGPTLFTLVTDEVLGKTVLSKLEADGLDAYLVHTIEAMPSATGSDS